MEQVLLKSFLLLNLSSSATVMHSPVQAVYEVLASVSTTWRTMARQRKWFTRTLLRHGDNAGQYITLDLSIVIFVIISTDQIVNKFLTDESITYNLTE